MRSNPGFVLAVQKSYFIQRKLKQTFLHGPVTWNVMQRNEWKDLANWQTRRLNNSTKYQLHALTTITLKKKELKSVGDLSKVCAQIVLKCLHLARIGRPDILSSVKTSLSVPSRSGRGHATYIHHTSAFKQHCHVGNTAQQCRLGLCQDSDFACDVGDSKSTSGGILCIFGSHTFVPTSWICTKQTWTSHSSTEAVIISLDAGLRMDGIPALDFWNLVFEVFHYSQNQSIKTKDSWAQGDLLHYTTSSKRTKNQTKAPTTRDTSDLFHTDNVPSNATFSHCNAMWLNGLPALELWDLIVSVLGNVSRVSDRSGQPDSDVHKHHKSQKKINVMKDIDSVPPNVQSARQEALLYVFEDNEAVIKMIIKGRSPTMRHVSRTHRVALDCLFDRINLDPKIQIG